MDNQSNELNQQGQTDDIERMKVLLRRQLGQLLKLSESIVRLLAAIDDWQRNRNP